MQLSPVFHFFFFFGSVVVVVVRVFVLFCVIYINYSTPVEIIMRDSVCSVSIVEGLKCLQYI